MEPVDALQLLGGSARTRDLVRRCSRRAVQQALASGDVVRVARGRYALADASRDAVAVAAAPGVRAGVSAARAYGWSTLHRHDGAVVAVLPGQRVDPVAGVTYLRRRLSAEERREGRTDPLTTVADCATSLPFVDALAVADAALRSGQVQHEELLELAAASHGHGVADLRRVARHADPRLPTPSSPG